MITILVVLLLVFALAGGFWIHPLLFAIALVALVLLLVPRGPRAGPPL